MDRRILHGLLVLLMIAVVSSGCGRMETPPPSTVTPMPRPTRVIGAEAQPAAPVLSSATQPTATPVPARTVATAMPTPMPTVGAPTPIPTVGAALVAAPLPTLTSVPPQASVREGALNVRSGPGAGYPRLGQLEAGAAVEITGQNAQGSWWQIAYPTASDGRGWVSAGYVQTSGQVTAKVVEAPPPPPTSVPTSSGKIVFQETSGGRIFIIGADGRGLRQLTHGLDPALSPDGTQVAFARWEVPAGIYLVRVDGTGERLLAPVEKAKGLQWSRDGTKIAYTHEGSGGWLFYFDSVKEELIKQKDPFWKIAVADVATGQVHDVHSDNHSFAPSWSSDGWWLVYDGEQGLMLTDATGADSKRWQQVTFGVKDMSPEWSPAPSDNPWAARMAYQRYFNDHWEVVTLLPSGQGLARLTPSPLFQAAQNSVAPTWSPDGRWIAFLTDRRGQWEIWTMRSDGSQQQPMFPATTLAGIQFHYEAQSEQVLNWGP